jgi:TP901 family phage tail tape measure protein
MSEAATDILLRIRVDVTNVQAIAKLGAALDRAQASMAKMNNANVKVGKSTGVLMGAYEKFSNRLNRVERSMDAVFRAGVHLQAMGRDLVGFGKKVVGVIDNMLDKWGEFEFTLNRAAGAAGIFDTTLPIYEAMKRGVQDLAREMRVFPAEEVAKGLYFWQSTTGEVIKTEDDLARQLSYVRDIMKLSAMTNTNYETSIKGVYAVLKQFNLPMKETGHVVELLHFATQKTALEFPNLIESFKMFGAVAGNADEPLETMVAVLGALGDAGFRGSQVGRALRQTYIKLVKPTAAAKEKLDELFKSQGGYNKVAFDAKGNFVGMEKYIWKLAKATKNMTYEQKANLLATITTANELPVMTEMLDIAHKALADGAKSWVDYRLNQKDATEAFKKSWDILAGSWAGIKGLLKQTIEPVLLNIGQMIAKKLTPIIEELSETIYLMAPAFEDTAKVIMDTVMPAIDWLLGAFQKVMNWAKKNPAMVKQFAKWAALGTIFAVVAGAIMLAVGTLIFFVNTIVLVIAGMLPMLGAIAAVILAFVYLGTKVYQNTSGIRDAIGNLVNSLVSAFDRLFGGVEGVGGGLMGLLETLDGLVNVGLGYLADAINWLADAIDKITPEHVEIIKKVGAALLIMVGVNKLLGPLSTGIWGVTKALQGMSLVVGGVQTATSFLPSLPGKLGGLITALRAVGSAFMGLMTAAGPVGWVILAIAAAVTAFIVAYETNFLGFKDFIDGLVQWFVTNVGPIIAGVFQWLQEVIPPILQTLADIVQNVLLPAWNQFITWATETFGPMFEQMGATIQAFLDFIGTIPPIIEAIVTAISQWIESLGIDWDAVWSAIGIAVGTAIEIIKTIIGTGLAYIWSVWNGIWSAVTTFLKGVVEGIVKVITGFWQIIEGIFEIAGAVLSGNWDGLWAGIEDIIRGILSIIEGVVRGFVSIFQGIWNGMTSFVLTIFKTVFGEGEGSIYWTIKGFIDTITEFGGAIIEGLVAGIGDAVDWAIRQVEGFFGSIIDGVKDFLGISSPATIMLSIGKNIVAGLWKGINDAKDWIIGKLSDFIKNVIPGPIKDVLGISSPSKLMMGLGENIVQGLALGIERTDDAYNAMVAQADSITKAMMGVSETATAVSGSFTSTSTADATRNINLEVSVTSGDGSVSSLDMTTLANLITGSDMVRALEMMATVE